MGWVCRNCHELNGADCDNCKSCHAPREQMSTSRLKSQREHKKAAAFLLPNEGNDKPKYSTPPTQEETGSFAPIQHEQQAAVKKPAQQDEILIHKSCAGIKEVPCINAIVKEKKQLWMSKDLTDLESTKIDEREDPVVMKVKDYLVVAALDFGTTYSGYAFSFRNEFKEDPLKIHANQAWNTGGRSLLSLKTPTSLLLNEHKELEAFGYDAENMYNDLVMDKEQNKFYFFHRFKMKLHDKGISREMVLKDITGKPALAIDIFSMAIKALVDHLRKFLEKHLVEMNEILWVLTVPAIWSDAAKQFMRQSAEKAGIHADHLKIALESEAASIYCQYLPTKKLKGVEQGFTMTEPGSTYMVVDLGGGTADITVHKKLTNGGLEEVTRANGNDCGGTSVDGRFFQMLTKIVGGPVMKSLQEEEPEAYLDIFRGFETLKRTLKTTTTGKVNMSIPFASWNEICKDCLDEEMSEVLEQSVYKDRVTLLADKMRIDAILLKEIFQPTIDSIISLMKGILIRDVSSNVTEILMVGEFSNCSLVQDAVKRAFPNKKVIIPDEPGLSVLKGAVLSGHRPDYIHARKMKYTYGIELQTKFDPSIHDSKRRVIIDGIEYCDKIFEKLVTINETVPVGMTINRSYSTPGVTAETHELSIYISTDENPQYTDHKNCNQLGKATIPLSTSCVGERLITVNFYFGGTEIALTARERNSGNVYTATFKLI